MPEDSEELKIKQKIIDMMVETAYPAIAQYPKSEKLALGLHMKDIMDTMLDLTIEAQKKYYKKTTLHDLDVCIAKLKTYVRISFDLKFLPMKKYEVWSAQLKEIGKMLGGWLKTVDQKPASHRE